MVFDQLKNHHLYEGLGSRISKAFHYLTHTDFNTLETGKHVIDGDDVFAIYMEYDTKLEDGALYEGHHRYIDVQYVFSGEEHMGIKPFSGQNPSKSSEADDYDLYDIRGNLIHLPAGSFMILYPMDLHCPGLTTGNPTTVRKVVVKVRIDWRKIVHPSFWTTKSVNLHPHLKIYGITGRYRWFT